MTRQRVSSTSVRSIGYDEGNRILEIELKNGGVYQYFQVPAEKHKELIESESVGRYYAKIIKPSYKYRRIR